MVKRAPQSSHPDVLIIGAGIIGSLLSVALRDTPFQVLLCDASDFPSKVQADFDARSIALNQASINILTQLGLWDNLKAHATPIQTIQISSQHQFGAAQLKAPHDNPLGAVVEMHRFYAALEPHLNLKQTLMHARLTHYDPKTQTATLMHQGKSLTLKPKLVVAADGTASTLRPFLHLTPHFTEYGQHAVVTNIALKRHHQFHALERFTQAGPLALLPLEQHRMALVWCMTPDHAKTLMQVDDQVFLNSLQSAVGYRLGRIIQVGKRMCYPLSQLVMPRLVADQVVFVGNAAQTLHPVAGQGLNLGLRDIATLAQCLIQHGLTQASLQTYQTLREPDRQAITKASHYLVQLFTHRSLPLRLLRSLGLMAFDQTQILQPALIRYASGLGSSPPDLACGIPLYPVKPRTHHGV